MNNRAQPRKPISESLRGTVQRVAKHEAGHLVVSRVYGFRIGDCTATVLDSMGAYKGGAEITLARPLVSLEEIARYLDQRIQVLYAGALAESLMANGKIVNEVAINCVKSGAAKDDFAKARELIQLARNLKHPLEATYDELHAQLNAIDNVAWNAAAVCVEKESPLILGIAGRIAAEVMAAGLGGEARISAAEINALPAMTERFGADSNEQVGCQG